MCRPDTRDPPKRERLDTRLLLRERAPKRLLTVRPERLRMPWPRVVRPKTELRPRLRAAALERGRPADPVRERTPNALERVSPREDVLRPLLDTALRPGATPREPVLRLRTRPRAAWLRPRWADERRLELLGPARVQEVEERFQVDTDLLRCGLACEGVRVRLRASAPLALRLHVGARTLLRERLVDGTRCLNALCDREREADGRLGRWKLLRVLRREKLREGCARDGRL